MRTWPFNWHLIRYAPRVFGVHSFFHILFISAPVALGLIEKAFFDTLTGTAPAAMGLWALVGLYVSVSLGRLALSFIDIWYEVGFRFLSGALLRRNMLAGLLRRPGALPLPMPVGEAVSRYRNDVGEVTDFPLWLPDVAGNLLAFALAVLIMAQINLTITLVIFLPLFALVGVARAAWARLLYYYEAGANATDRVSGFLGEALGAVQALKVAGVERHIVVRLFALNDERRRLKVRERLLHEILFAVTDNLVVFGTGVILLLAGQAMSAGTFSVGDFALFTFYLTLTTHLPTYLGTFLGDYKQQEAAIRRLGELIPGEPAAALVDHRPPTSDDRPGGPVAPGPAASVVYRASAPQTTPLLALRGLSYRHPGSGRGVVDVELDLPAGGLTVVVGRVGAGKTTLLRTLLGLLPAQAGTLHWRGAPVGDAATFFRPPRSAYTPQVARLFSASLRENIALGAPADAAAITLALRQAVLEPDLASMPAGLDTLVGPRGVRLSGGQVQRTAAARMLVRQPELLVCDDLSSALDVETEARLWERIAASTCPPTILAVSHRPALLRRADQIVVLDEGRVADVGRLDELLERSATMRALYNR